MPIAPHHFEIVKKPLVTEKSSGKMVESIYAFEVARDANKIQIKAAIEAIWNVKVASVRTLNGKGEMRRNRFGHFNTGTSRKAYVKLKEGYAIELV
ncbi:MAG: 50S ribosomal protein L23 [Planctomycetes bacterium]|nr:50S ribosomal protein L23 [Planctomycetota bacterium]NUQ35610.1 50S ribosomal protein L23 [Planctomycetaceae bacterium]